MRSSRVTPNTVATPNEWNALHEDARGASRLLAHQMYGTIALPTNPTNAQTLTLDINGTNVVITFVSAIGSTAGNVLIGASAAATAANLLQLLQNSTITNTTQVAIGANTSANVTLINYIAWSLTGTSIIASSNAFSLFTPDTSFSASTTVTGGSYTAKTMALFIEPGVTYVNGTEVYFTGGVTPTVTAPASHPRIDVLSMDNTGTLNWTTGTEASSPTTPTYPANQIPICELYNVVGETALYDQSNEQSGQGYIYNDVRPFLSTGVNLSAVPDSILPAADGTYNLGSASFEWNNIYAKSGIFLNGNAFGTQLTFSTTALEAISAGAPVAAGLTQATDIEYDTSGKTTTTGSITIGSNSNRVLIILSLTQSGTNPTGTFAGSAITFTSYQVTVATNPYTMAVGYVVAPPTGSGSLSLSNAGNIFYWSLYNCAQTSPIDKEFIPLTHVRN